MQYFLTFNHDTKKYEKNIMYYNNNDIKFLKTHIGEYVGTIQLCNENGNITDAKVFKSNRTFYFSYYVDGSFYPMYFSFRHAGNGLNNLKEHISRQNTPLKNTITIIPNY